MLRSRVLTFDLATQRLRFQLSANIVYVCIHPAYNYLPTNCLATKLLASNCNGRSVQHKEVERLNITGLYRFSEFTGTSLFVPLFDQPFAATDRFVRIRGRGTHPLEAPQHDLDC